MSVPARTQPIPRAQNPLPRRPWRSNGRFCASAGGLGVALLAGVASLAIGSEADASPGVDGTRNLSMGNATRGSSAGTNAAIINPAGLSYTQQFAIEPVYQYDVQTRTHGLGVFVTDSLNTPRLALGLGYVFMRGSPNLLYDGSAGERETLSMVHFGHEVSGSLSVVAVKNWLYIGLKPKWQYTSLRYLDDEGVARDFAPKLNAFGLDAAIAINFLDYVHFAVVGYNLVGPSNPAWTDPAAVELEGVATADDLNANPENLRRVSDYPRMVSHGLAVFPLRHPNFSLNLDATYDFSSYWAQDKWTRITVNAGGEFVAGPVPIRVGGWWDRRGPGGADDRGYVTAGLGFIKPAQLGGVGVDVGAGFAQQVTGADRVKLDTVFSINVGIRLRPDL